MNTFWHGLPKPFFVLAPMEDVTDAAFRHLIAQHSGNTGSGEHTQGADGTGVSTVPRVMFTEFTSADGLVRADERGQEKLRKKLLYSEGERPIVAQLFTSVPEHMEQAARLAAELGFDGIDINMGCPDRAIERQQCGASLIKNPSLARELIRAAKRGAGHTGRNVPVSVKTRLGYNADELETWLPELLAEEPAAVTVHARTRKELSLVPARWERVARAVQIRNEHKSKTLIVGNGDVKDLADARQKVVETGCDGVMLGRAVFGNPWLFTEEGSAERTPQERISALIEHIELFKELLSGTTSEALMKRHFKAYIHGWEGAKELRLRLMESESLSDALVILHEH